MLQITEKNLIFFFRKMKIDVLIGLLVVMVTVRETMAVIGAVMAGIGAAGAVAGGTGGLSKAIIGKRYLFIYFDFGYFMYM